MKFALIVGIGSFFGGMCRYLLTMFVQTKAGQAFPFGTLAVNLIGCFLIGCLAGLFEKWALNMEWRLLCITGFIGGFTTFSAFSIETYHLIKNGHAGIAITYVAASLVLGIAFTFLGGWIFKVAPIQ